MKQVKLHAVTEQGTLKSKTETIIKPKIDIVSSIKNMDLRKSKHQLIQQEIFGRFSNIV